MGGPYARALAISANFFGAVNVALLTWDRYGIALASSTRSLRELYDKLLDFLGFYVAPMFREGLYQLGSLLNQTLLLQPWSKYTIALGICAATGIALSEPNIERRNATKVLRAYIAWLVAGLALGVIAGVLSGDYAEKVAVVLLVPILSGAILQVTRLFYSSKKHETPGTRSTSRWAGTWPDLRFDIIPIALIALLLTNEMLKLLGA